MPPSFPLIPIEALIAMARNKGTSGDAAPLPQYRVYGFLGRFTDGDIVTTDDLFPDTADQAELDGHLQRLFGLSAIAPYVEFAAHPAPVPPTVPPTVVTRTDSRTVPVEHEAAPPPPAFKAPASKPVDANANEPKSS